MDRSGVEQLVLCLVAPGLNVHFGAVPRKHQVDICIEYRVQSFAGLYQNAQVDDSSPRRRGGGQDGDGKRWTLFVQQHHPTVGE
jgi:hypothetical protein